MTIRQLTPSIKLFIFDNSAEYRRDYYALRADNEYGTALYAVKTDYSMASCPIACNSCPAKLNRDRLRALGRLDTNRFTHCRATVEAMLLERSTIYRRPHVSI